MNKRILRKYQWFFRRSNAECSILFSLFDLFTVCGASSIFAYALIFMWQVSNCGKMEGNLRPLGEYLNQKVFLPNSTSLAVMMLHQHIDACFALRIVRYALLLSRRDFRPEATWYDASKGNLVCTMQFVREGSVIVCKYEPLVPFIVYKWVATESSIKWLQVALGERENGNVEERDANAHQFKLCRHRKMNYTASDNSRFHTLLSFSLSCSYQNNHPSKMQVFILWPLTKRTFLVVMALSALFASVISHHDFDSPTPTEQFLSAVSIANGTKHICNGVILNKRWIITSAYCLENYIVPTDLEVNFGTRIGRQSKFSVVEKIVVHPDYHQRYFLNNVALIKVQADMEFNAGVQASGLPIADAEEDDVVYAVAWAKADQNVWVLTKWISLLFSVTHCMLSKHCCHFFVYFSIFLCAYFFKFCSFYQLRVLQQVEKGWDSIRLEWWLWIFAGNDLKTWMPSKWMTTSFAPIHWRIFQRLRVAVRWFRRSTNC